MASPLEYQIRTGPQGLLNEGAFEDGRVLTVNGKKLEVGEKVPDFNLWYLGPTDSVPRIVKASSFSPNYLLYTVNGFATSVCAKEAIVGRDFLRERHVTGSDSLIGVSNEDPEFLRQWTRDNNIGHKLYSADKTDFGIRFGTAIAQHNGQLQRALFGIGNGRIVYAEYVYDQGGALPDFHVALTALQNAV